MRAQRYTEETLGNLKEVLLSKLVKPDQRRPNDLPTQGSNTQGDADMYNPPDLLDPGYPGALTGTGHGPELGHRKYAYPTQPISGLLSDSDPMLRSGFGYSMGAKLADPVAYGKPRLRWVGKYLSDLGTRPLLAAGKGALGGAAAGAGFGWLTGRDPIFTTGAGALLGGLASGGAGLLMKSSSLMDDLGYIERRLQLDNGLPFAARTVLEQALDKLQPGQAHALADAVRASFGGSIAALVARYLLGLGLVGTSIFALLGAAAGVSLGGANRNAFGERVRQVDGLGRPL